MQYALSCWMFYGIPLSLSQTSAVSANSPQKVSPIVRDSRAYKRDQFRVHWNARAFYLLFRSDQELHTPICRAYLIGNRSDTRGIEISTPLSPAISFIGSVATIRP